MLTQPVVNVFYEALLRSNFDQVSLLADAIKHATHTFNHFV